MAGKKTFLLAADVAKLLNVGKTQAYAIIKKLNTELEKQGFLTIDARVSRTYFEKRFGVSA